MTDLAERIREQVETFWSPSTTQPEREHVPYVLGALVLSEVDTLLAGLAALEGKVHTTMDRLAMTFDDQGEMKFFDAPPEVVRELGRRTKREFATRKENKRMREALEAAKRVISSFNGPVHPFTGIAVRTAWEKIEAALAQPAPETGEEKT